MYDVPCAYALYIYVYMRIDLSPVDMNSLPMSDGKICSISNRLMTVISAVRGPR